MDLLNLSGYSGLYGLNGIYGLSGMYGLNGLCGLNGLYGLNSLNGTSSVSGDQTSLLYPAASYARFSDALQKAVGGRQDLEKVFDRMQEDPDYKKEVLDLLQKGFGARYPFLSGSGLMGGKTAESGAESHGVQAPASDGGGNSEGVRRNWQAELYEQSCRRMSMGSGGSLADRLAANRSARISERESGKHF